MGGIGEVAYRLKNTEFMTLSNGYCRQQVHKSQYSGPRNEAMNSVTKLYKNMCYMTAHKFQ